MADATEIVKSLNKKYKISFPVLIPNIKGTNSDSSLTIAYSLTGFENFYAATEGRMKEIAIFTSASESFSQKNTNCSVSESLERLRIVTKAASDKNIRVRGYVSCIVKCPYDGQVDPDNVLKASKELLDMGCYEISLGDTIGAATPGKLIVKFLL